MKYNKVTQVWNIQHDVTAWMTFNIIKNNNTDVIDEIITFIDYCTEKVKRIKKT